MKRSPHGVRRNLAAGPRRVNRPRPEADRGYLACGWHAATAFLQNRPNAVRQVLLQAPPKAEFSGLLGRSRIAAKVVTPAVLDNLSGGVVHQGVIVQGEAPPAPGLAPLLESRPRLLLALDNVTDPRNIGAIARTAEAAGFGGLLLTRDRAPDLSPALVKTAAGAVEFLPFCRVTNLVRALDILGKAGYWRIGLDAGGEIDVLDVDAVPGMPAVLVAGAEGKGIRPLVRRSLDRIVSIPMVGHTASLNVSVACGIAIAAMARAGRAAEGPRP
ncbi:MAG: RNA methyltransferase [Deltaproteobacteria bacterium]